MEKCNLEESKVIESYKQCHSARIVAEQFGVSYQTIYRVLEKNGVERRKPKQERKKRPTKARKYCPGLVGMLYGVLGLDEKKISACTGISISSVYAILNRRFSRTATIRKRGTSKKDIDLDALEAEYLAGASTYELGEKYGVAHQTIGKWMKKRGHVRGKGWQPEHLRTGTNKGHETQKQRAIEKLKNKLIEDTGGLIVLVEFGGEKSTYRCTVCGSVFTRCRDSRGYKVTCQTCFEKEISLRKKEREAQRAEREKERAEELAKDKVCESCGCVFHSESPKAKYCSGTCSRRAKRHRDVAAGKMLLTNSGEHRKRARIYGVAYEPGITVKKLVIRDNNICQICGEPCDSNDHRWSEHFGPLYPTIDHIIAMANGGGHTWDNVQLAHAICNSVKRDLTEEELTEEVITHAKEQAIADKCA